MTHLLILLALAAQTAAPPPPAEEWEYGPDGWRESEPTVEALGAAEREPDAEPVPAGQIAPRFDAIQADLDAGRGKRAFKRAVRWLRANPGEPGYDQALYLAAQGLFDYGNRVKAFFYLDQLLDEYPQSPLWEDALGLQYRIADEYLDGYKDRLLGLALQPAEADGVEMLFRIRERVPQSPLGERALLRTGDFYYANEEYDLAALVYGTYLDRFPRSPTAPRVKLRQAYSNLLQYDGARYDPTPIIDARTQLLELRQTSPALAERADVDRLVLDIDRQLAAKRLETADYYRRTDEPTAAALELRAAARNFPQTPEAEVAAERLDRMGVALEPATRPGGDDAE